MKARFGVQFPQAIVPASALSDGSADMTHNFRAADEKYCTLGEQ
jgi:hypothetical protein